MKNGKSVSTEKPKNWYQKKVDKAFAEGYEQGRSENSNPSESATKDMNELDLKCRKLQLQNDILWAAINSALQPLVSIKSILETKY